MSLAVFGRETAVYPGGEAKGLPLAERGPDNPCQQVPLFVGGTNPGPWGN